MLIIVALIIRSGVKRLDKAGADGLATAVGGKPQTSHDLRVIWPHIHSICPADLISGVENWPLSMQSVIQLLFNGKIFTYYLLGAFRIVVILEACYA